MFLSNLSIKQPVFATMMMAALAVLGISSYQQLNVDQFPEVEFPIVTVTTRYAGASPETVERDVTRKIEESINTVEGVRHIESSSQEGISSIIVQFRLEVPTQVASQDIRSKVASIRSELPREIEEPLVLRINPAEMPIVSVGVNAEGMSAQAATDLADKTIKRRLETVEGVGAVNLVGEANREIGVVVDRTRLEAYRFSLSEVVNALQSENLDTPAGSADRGATESLVRVAARGRTAAQIANIPIKRVDDATIFVHDVAHQDGGAVDALDRNVADLRRRAAARRDAHERFRGAAVG